MMKTLAIYGLILAFFFLSGTHSATITFTNNCPYTVWPGSLTADQKPQLSNTGFELTSKASLSLDVAAPWKGRFWARTLCSTDSSGKFSCATAECSTGQVACNDGFNLPVSVATQGGTGDCQTSTCPANVNAVCPAELQVKGSDGSVIACKSACVAFNEPQYCCTGAYNTPATCPPTNYSKIFEDQCPQAYSYAYDDQNSTFTCSGGPNYTITFCP
uniref:Thaumatin-like protein n=1 Tax=Fagus sylvatica TaxID=28930 RepID=A0A2N9GMY2_FAGSY